MDEMHRQLTDNFTKALVDVSLETPGYRLIEDFRLFCSCSVAPDST